MFTIEKYILITENIRCIALIKLKNHRLNTLASVMLGTFSMVVKH